MGVRVGSFQVVETFLGAPVHVLSGITDMQLVASGGVLRLYTATRAGGGVLALEIGGEIRLLDQQATAAGSTLPAPARLEVLTLAGRETLIVTGANASRVGGFALAEDGSLGRAAQIIGSPGGAIASQVVATVGTQTFLYVNQMGDNAILGYRLSSSGRATLVSDTPAHAELQGVDVAGMATVRVGGTNFLLSLSAAQDALRSYKVQADGDLVQASSLGANGGLGIAAPSALETVVVEGRTYALVAAAGSSSISVVEVGATGRLSLVDHVIDTRDTRFQGVQALATVTLGDRVLVFAGGGDDGVNVFTLLPDGRLLLTGERLKASGLPLDNITAMTAKVVGDVVELFVAGEGRGLMRLRFEPGPLAPLVTAGAGGESLTGTTAGDMLRGRDGADTILGGSGDDILIDGGGTDSLSGGAGADTFVLGADGEAEIILDYQVGIDRLDLTAWGRVYSMDAVTFQARANGALLSFGAESVLILSSNGQPIAQSAFLASELFGLWHVVAVPVVEGIRIEGSPLPDELRGDAGDDTLVGSAGADLLDGQGGFDIVDYGAATDALVADLADPSANAGLAAGDIYVSVEGVIGGQDGDGIGGTAGENLLRGALGSDRISGRGGADLIYGGGGDDTLTGGAGADRLVGGAGIDRAQYGDSPEGVTIDLQYPGQNTGHAAGDRLELIEEVAGSGHADLMRGGRYGDRLLGLEGADLLAGRNGDDVLIGGDGDDTLQGDAGDDTLLGGDGADWAMLVSGGPVVVDLSSSAPQTTPLGTDVLIGIEHLLSGAGADRLTGSEAANWLIGEAGDDTLTGGAGADTLQGGAGHDQLIGGSGTDTAIFGGELGARIDLLLQGPQATGHGVDWLEEIERLLTGEGADRLAGSHGANLLSAGAGNDSLLGRQGDDGLIGGAGNDLLSGGAGSDALFGNAGVDTAFFAGPVAVTVTLAHTGWQDTGHGRDRLAGIENLVSGAGADRLTGSDGANRVKSMGGNDRVWGMAGKDTLIGGAGDDTLLGGSGRDRLDGGTGNDRMFGGGGADVFVFSGGRDVIGDFARAGGDRIVIDDAALALPHGITAGRLVRHYGEDLGQSVMLDFGAGNRLVLEDVASLRWLADHILIV